MQTYLETKGKEVRDESLVRNDYERNDPYSVLHSDALSNGDPLGKGTGIGGHTHSMPNIGGPSYINYADFDTSNGGGLYDIEGRGGVGGRNFLKNISLYNDKHEYGPNLIDTSLNRADGQVSF